MTKVVELWVLGSVWPSQNSSFMTEINSSEDGVGLVPHLSKLRSCYPPFLTSAHLNLSLAEPELIHPTASSPAQPPAGPITLSKGGTQHIKREKEILKKILFI